MSELHEFQVSVARRWLERADGTSDHFSQFFFLFAAFNALYFMWAETDHPLNSDGIAAGEAGQIDHLVRKLDDTVAAALLSAIPDSLAYFVQRPPIQRMDRRLTGASGDPDEGAKWRKKLRSADAREQVRALARMLYLVRSNMVHGSKVASGDDEVLIIHAVPALRALVGSTVVLSRPA